MKNDKNITVNVQMRLISKGINIQKNCKTQREVNNFERDMPAKYGLLFSKTPYIIGKVNLSLTDNEVLTANAKIF